MSKLIREGEYLRVKRVSVPTDNGRKVTRWDVLIIPYRDEDIGGVVMRFASPVLLTHRFDTKALAEDWVARDGREVVR